MALWSLAGNILPKIPTDMICFNSSSIGSDKCWQCLNNQLPPMVIPGPMPKLTNAQAHLKQSKPSGPRFDVKDVMTCIDYLGKDEDHHLHHGDYP